MGQSGFNPKARWDRHIPEDINSAPDFMNERINVIAWFKDAKIYPRLFLWKNKKYEIKRIAYNWQERCGSQTLVYFSVETACGFYQISFNNTTFGWRLDKVIE